MTMTRTNPPRDVESPVVPQPTIGVVIPTFNQAKFLPMSIEGVLGQDLKPAQVVVINDGSTDETESVLREFGSRIEWITIPNSGVSAARNRGLALLNTDLVAFCDSDDVWSTRKLSMQVARLRLFPDSLWCHAAVELIDEDGDRVGLQSEGAEGWALGPLVQLQAPAILGGGSGVLVDRQVVIKIGGFREDLSTSADWHLFARLAAISRVSFVDEPLLHYRLHSRGMHNNVNKWKVDMRMAIRDLRSRGLVDAKTERRALAELGHQVAGELALRGNLRPALLESAAAIQARPASIGRVFRRVPVAFKHLLSPKGHHQQMRSLSQ